MVSASKVVVVSGGSVVVVVVAGVVDVVVVVVVVVVVGLVVVLSVVVDRATILAPKMGLEVVVYGASSVEVTVRVTSIAEAVLTLV